MRPTRGPRACRSPQRRPAALRRSSGGATPFVDQSTRISVRRTALLPLAGSLPRSQRSSPNCLAQTVRHLGADSAATVGIQPPFRNGGCANGSRTRRCVQRTTPCRTRPSPPANMPSVHTSSCPLRSLCQLVRAPGVKRTSPQVSGRRGPVTAEDRIRPATPPPAPLCSPASTKITSRRGRLARSSPSWRVWTSPCTGPSPSTSLVAGRWSSSGSATAAAPRADGVRPLRA